MASEAKWSWEMINHYLKAKGFRRTDAGFRDVKTYEFEHEITRQRIRFTKVSGLRQTVYFEDLYESDGDRGDTYLMRAKYSAIGRWPSLMLFISLLGEAYTYPTEAEPQTGIYE